MHTDTAPRVLIVDDDRSLCLMLAEYLAGEAFAVTSAHDGYTGLDAARSEAFDLMVLDITMPGIDGFETLRRLRTFSSVPVLMLTARGDDLDRIVGLELGADDYLPKPFNPRELAARVRAILRRARGDGSVDGTLGAGALVLDPAGQSVRVGGRAVTVTGTEFAVLAALVRAAGTVVSREALAGEALGRRLTPFDRSLDTHVSNLRRKLGPGPGGETRIRAVRGRGYLLVVAGRAG